MNKIEQKKTITIPKMICIGLLVTSFSGLAIGAHLVDIGYWDPPYDSSIDSFERNVARTLTIIIPVAFVPGILLLVGVFTFTKDEGGN